PSRRLGEFLVERKVLSRNDLEEALVTEEKEGVPLAKVLVSRGLVGERDLVAAVAHQMGMPFHDFDHQPINPMVDRVIPAELARRSLAVAVDIDGIQLIVAMEDPSSSEVIEQLQVATGWAIRPVLAVRSDLKRLVHAMYGGPKTDGVIEIDLVDAPGPESGLTADLPEGEVHVNERLQRVVELGGPDLQLTAGTLP